MPCHLCVCDSDTWAPASKTFPFSNSRHECTPRQKWHASCLFSQGPHSGVRCPSCHCSEGTQNAAKQSFTIPSQNLPVIRPQSTQGLQRSNRLRFDPIRFRSDPTRSDPIRSDSDPIRSDPIRFRFRYDPIRSESVRFRF